MRRDTREEEGSGRRWAFFLIDLLLWAYGKDVSQFLTITFHKVGDKDIRKVMVTPSTRLVFIEMQDDRGQKAEHLFVRIGNSSRQLSMSEMHAYSKTRW